MRLNIDIEIKRHSFYIKAPLIGVVFCEWSGWLAEQYEHLTSLKPWLGKVMDERGERFVWAGRLLLIHTPVTLA